MGSFGSSSSPSPSPAPQQPAPTAGLTPPPAPPSPQNEYYYENGTLRSAREFGTFNGNPRYYNYSYNTPDEQAIENKSTGYIKDLVNRATTDLQLTPEKLQAGVDAYTKPQEAALTDSYNQAKGQALQQATGQGMQNSVGFGNYTANVLEKNKAQGLADIKAQGEQLRYDLPNKAILPYTNQFNLFNAAVAGQQASTAQDFNPAFQGSQASNNFALQNYGNQLAYSNALNANLPQQQAMAQQQQAGRGGLFNFFTGGV